MVTKFDTRSVNNKNEWLTPPWILERLGTFDLDPCAPISRPWETARQHFTVSDNGLSKQWQGRVWCNPPYGSETWQWVKRCSQHGNAIVLIFARTDTRTFFDHVWGRADGMLFIKGRLSFYHASGQQADFNGGAPSVLLAFGSANADCLKNSGINGAWVGATEIIGSPKPSARSLKAEIAAVANTIIECEAGSVTVDFAALKRHLLRLSAISER
jgi:hypothetical protein